MEISFKANVILDKNYAKNPPKSVDRANLLEIANQYKEVMEDKRTLGGALTEGDTVILSTKNSREGYYLYTKFYKDGIMTKEPYFEWFTCKARNIKTPFSIHDLYYPTKLFLAKKSGYEKRPGENALRYAQRGLEFCIEQYKKRKQGAI